MSAYAMVATCFYYQHPECFGRPLVEEPSGLTPYVYGPDGMTPDTRYHPVWEEGGGD